MNIPFWLYMIAAFLLLLPWLVDFSIHTQEEHLKAVGFQWMSEENVRKELAKVRSAIIFSPVFNRTMHMLVQEGSVEYKEIPSTFNPYVVAERQYRKRADWTPRHSRESSPPRNALALPRKNKTALARRSRRFFIYLGSRRSSRITAQGSTILGSTIL
jgi:hypothetical protein